MNNNEIIINLYAGNGGNGCNSFNKSRKSSYLIPNGGNGGYGGNIFIISDNKIKDLVKFNFKNKFKAENGKKGRKNNCCGKNGNNLFIKVPINTKIYNYNTLELITCLKKNSEYILVAKGGNKGLGNNVLKKFNKNKILFNNRGNIGEHRIIKLELELKSDIGIIGLVNSGKSSLINILSNSNSKVENYNFSTKKCVLGFIYDNIYLNYSIIDTPGIIKGSYFGKGLGLSFLENLNETKLLLFIIDIESIKKNSILESINIINNEIFLYNKIFENKEIWILINKIDLINNFNTFKKNIEKNTYLNRYKIYFISCKKNIGVNFLLNNIFYFFNKNINN